MGGRVVATFRSICRRVPLAIRNEQRDRPEIRGLFTEFINNPPPRTSGFNGAAFN
jgi:hypothetical protein